MDHYQGINKILQDDKNFQVENVYITDIALPDSVKKVCENAKLKDKTKVVNLGVGKTKEINVNGTVIKLYGPAISLTAMGNKYNQMSDSEKQNNLSMTVKVEAAGLSCLILGDQQLEGLELMKDVYKDVFQTSSQYKVCKFGHHGLRNTELHKDEVSSKTVKEKKFFEKNYKANLYYLSASREKVHLDKKLKTLTGKDRRLRKNFVYFKRNLTGDVSTAVAAYEGNLEVSTNGRRVTTKCSKSTGAAMY